MEVSEEALELIAERGYDPAFGARPIKRRLRFGRRAGRVALGGGSSELEMKQKQRLGHGVGLVGGSVWGGSGKGWEPLADIVLIGNPVVFDLHGGCVFWQVFLNRPKFGWLSSGSLVLS